MISIHELCQLAMTGDLEAIKNADVSSDLVNQLTSWSVISGTASYLGSYNAVMIAAAYRHLEVVKYFVEVKGASLDLKGGRLSNWTVLDCARNFSGVEPALVSYLEEAAAKKLAITEPACAEATSPQPKRSYRDALLFNLKAVDNQQQSLSSTQSLSPF